MNTSIETVAQPSAQSKLPALDKQTLKFAHFRYKVIPLETSLREEFQERVNLPLQKAYSAALNTVEETAVYPFGGVTAAFKINPETGMVEVGLSKCSILDTYNKRTGRLISAGRFERASKPHKRFPSLLKFNIEDAPKVNVETEMRRASTIARDMLVVIFNHEEALKDVMDDMSFIRSLAAYRSSIPFLVEIS